MAEKEIEEFLIKKLISQEYQKVDIKGKEDLENNLRTQIHLNNPKYLKDYPLTDEEFQRMISKLNNVKNSFEASQILRDKFTLERDNGEKILLNLYDTKNWCQNNFQVANQITIPSGNTFKKYDVTILINGFPMVQIELKNINTDIKRAFTQITEDYQKSYQDSLFNYIQLFVISNQSATQYFVNNGKGIKDFHRFTYTDDKNNKINSLSSFTEIFLNKCTLSEIISRYIIILQEKKELRVLRPYQIHAVKEIIQKAEHSNNGGYIWHTTGSGKTLTSFKASTILKDIDKIKKVLFVVDRKDLDEQTVKEFNHFEKDCVDETTNTKNLSEKLASNKEKDKIIVTTLQKLNRFLTKKDETFKSIIKTFQKERVVFIFDECHRSTFGDSIENIKKSFANHQFFGFTGTPILQESTNNTDTITKEGEKTKETTETLFKNKLHQYTISNAIADESVLAFQIADVKEKTNQTELTKNYIVNYIYKNHNTITDSKRFNSIFATSSIRDAIEYYKLFKEYQLKEDETPLKVFAVFSHQVTDDSTNQVTNNYTKDDNQDELPNESQDTTPQEIKTKAIKEIITDYNNQYNTSINKDEVTEYKKNISSRFKRYGEYLAKKESKETIDILIVVDMFLTGYDSPFTNALYVDKKLKEHGLIQAFSRTNRLEKSKPHGKIIDFYGLKDNIETAIIMYAGSSNDSQNQPTFKVPPFDEALQTLQNSYQNFQNTFAKHNLKCSTDDWQSIKSEEVKISINQAFSNLFKAYDKSKGYKLEEETDKQKIANIITEQDFNKFLGVYRTILSNERKNKVDNQEELQEQNQSTIEIQNNQINEEDIANYEHSYLIDYDYILKLLYKVGRSIADNTQTTLTLDKLKHLIETSTYLENIKPLLIDNLDYITNNFLKNNPHIQTEQEFNNEINLFLENKKEEIKNQIIQKYQADSTYINQYIDKFKDVEEKEYSLLTNSISTKGLRAKREQKEQLKEELDVYLKLISTKI